jgi:hypothetical protein
MGDFLKSVAVDTLTFRSAMHEGTEVAAVEA